MFDCDGQAVYFGVTPVENIFLTEYMPAAKGDYVKVYLLGLYHSRRAGEDYGVPEMAKELELTVSDVEAALRHWERRGLVTRVEGAKPTYRFHSVAQRYLTGQDQSDAADPKYVAFSESVYALFGDARKVRPADIAFAYEWVQDIGLTQETVLMLLSHMVMTRGTQFSFRRAQSLAEGMKEANVRTCEDAESFLRFEGETTKGAQAVLRRMGLRRLPTEDELMLYAKWRRAWGFDAEAILNACAAMTAGINPSFKYLDGILERLKEESAARTGVQVEKTLKDEEEKSKRLREFKDALGVKSTAKSVEPVYDELNARLPHGMILLAAGECARLGKNTLDSLQSLLSAWEEKDILTEQAARAYLNEIKTQNAFLQKMYEACGNRGKPGATDRELLSLWRAQGFKDDALLYAAAQAFAVEGGKMRYAAKVLEKWHALGAHTKAEAEKISLPPKQKDGGKTVSAQRYEQRDYSLDNFDQAFDMDEAIREAKEKR